MNQNSDSNCEGIVMNDEYTSLTVEMAATSFTPVGYWDIGNLAIPVTRKPSRFQIWMHKICLGWIWHDAQIT